MNFLELLKLIPRPIQLTLVGILIGGVAFAGHEARYMTVSQYTKSYVLDLKSEIREIRKDLANPDLPLEVREILQDALEAMLDDLCYEVPADPYCVRR